MSSWQAKSLSAIGFKGALWAVVVAILLLSYVLYTPPSTQNASEGAIDWIFQSWPALFAGTLAMWLLLRGPVATAHPLIQKACRLAMFFFAYCGFLYILKWDPFWKFVRGLGFENQNKTEGFLILVSTLFWLGLSLRVLFAFRLPVSGVGFGIPVLTKNRAPEMKMTRPAVTYADVGGMEDAKQQIREIVENRLNPGTFNKYGVVRNGVLLYGPRGSGKTFLAEATAGEFRLNYQYLSSPSLLNMWLGETGKNIREAFGAAAQRTPCLLFIDEIDALGAARDTGIGLAASTVRSIDLRYLERWAAERRRPVLRQLGVDEIHLGKKEKFLTVASNLESGEPLWFGRERKKETLDGFFQQELTARQRKGIEAACVDMWLPWRQSIEQWAPGCRIIYDKFHIMQHANRAVDEVRRAEFLRKGGPMRGLVKGKRWLLLTRWVNLTAGKRRQLNELFALNRRLLKAYLLKESLDRLWDYRYEGAMVRYFQSWMNQLRWQRLVPFEKLAEMLLDHLDGILNYCRMKVPLGVVEAINGNIKTLLRRGRGYKNLRYLLLKAQRLAATRTEFVAFEKAA